MSCRVVVEVFSNVVIYLISYFLCLSFANGRGNGVLNACDDLRQVAHVQSNGCSVTCTKFVGADSCECLVRCSKDLLQRKKSLAFELPLVVFLPREATVEGITIVIHHCASIVKVLSTVDTR